MRSRRFLISAIVLIAGLSTWGVAQTVDFDVLIDSDRSAVSGCTVTPSGGAPVEGIDARLRATVGQPGLQVISLETALCTGTGFGPGAPVGGVNVPFPVATNQGTGGSDVVEMAADRAALGADGVSLIEVVFASDNGSGSDVLATLDGTAGSGPILLGLPLQIPALSLLGLGLLIAALLVLAALAHRRMGRLGSVMAVMLVATAVWAMNFAADGDLADWLGAGASANDLTGDSTDGLDATDLVAAFVAFEGDRLYFRLDVADLENQPPTANDEAFVTDEDTLLNVAAPGVLANDTDPESDPLTAVLATAPANALSFTLNPDGSFDYTPAADFNGIDTFTYVANDGQADSNPATVTITVNPLNDAPAALDDSATTSEESAVDIDVLANDSDVDGNLVPGSVTVTTPPTDGTTLVDPATGVITYTKSVDFAGVDSFVYEVCDDGSPTPALCSTATVTITVEGVNDAPVNSVPGDQVAGAGLVFSAANGNAITVSDIDSDPDNLRVVVSVTAGTLAAIPTAGVSISGNGSASVTLEAPQALLNAALDGLAYTPAGGPTELLTVFTDDLGNTGSGGPLTDTDTVSLLIDAAPFVSSTVPAEGGIRALSGTESFVRIDFSESIDQAAGAVSIVCQPSGASVSVIAANGSTSNVLGDFGQQPGDSCTLTATSTLISDSDGIDPPDQLDGNNDGDGVEGDVDNFVLNYSIDSPPALTGFSPANGTTVATTAVLQASFDEPVDLGMGALTLDCAGPIAVTPSGSGTATLTFTPIAPLPAGASCTATLVAANITDSDVFDPPDNLPADVVINFAIDAAPEVVSTSPVDLAVVGTAASVSFDFSEAVDAAAGAITLECGSPIAGTVSGTGTGTLTFTPAAALPAGAACTATAVAAAITDSDAIDPPDNPVGNTSIAFTTDAPPTVLSTVPANGATDQDPTGTITINFSEAVNFDTTAGAANISFDLECPGGTPADFSVVTASPAASVVLDPVDNDIAASGCALTIRAAGISDVDAFDPPDNLPLDVAVTIGYGGVAADDVYAVTPHLLLGIDTGIQDGRVTANDLIGSGQVTGFGPVGSCNAVVTNGINFATTAGGGRVVMQTSGAFNYAPPAGLVGDGVGGTPEDGFCYTISGGASADVTLEFQNTELVWFVDVTYLGSNGTSDGTQARPYTTLGPVAAVDSANDTIHLASNPSVYDAVITLESGARLIGAGSGSDLATITGIVPVTGSTFPALGGSPPTIGCVGNCEAITLGANNTLRGFIIGDSGSTSGRDIVGANFGTLTVSELTLTGNGRALDLSLGSISGTFDDINATAGDSGIALANVGGNWSVTGAVDIGNVSGVGVNIINTPAGGSATFTGGLAINKTAAGAGVNFNANAAPIDLGAVNVTTGAGPALTLDNSAGLVTINSGTVSATGGPALNSSGSNLAISLASASSSNSNTQGINLNNISGVVNIAGGAINGSIGTAFLASGALGATSYAGSISKTSAGFLVDIGAGASGDLTLSGNMNCTAACSTGADAHGLRITGRSGGSITLSGATKIFRPSPASPNTMVVFDNNAGATINLSGTTALGLAPVPLLGTAYDFRRGGTINLSGNMDAFVQGARTLDIDEVTLSGAPGIGGFFSTGALGTGVPAIEITNSAAPSGVTFAQPLTLDHDDAGESGGGIRLVGNTGSYSFPNVLSINSTDTTVVFASNSGTLGIGATTTGTATSSNARTIDIAATTLAPDGVSFQSVNSFGGSEGIVLQNTGSTGFFRVSGDGTNVRNGSGGTIENSTGSGVVLSNAANVSLNQMLIRNNTASGVQGSSVTGFELAHSRVINNASVPGGVQAGLRFSGLLGSSSIDNSEIAGSFEDNIRIDASSGALASLTVNNADIGPNAAVTGGSGLSLLGNGTATMNVDVTGSRFLQNRAAGIQTTFTDNSALTIDVLGSSFDDNNTAIDFGIELNGDTTFTIENNLTIVNHTANAINIISGTGTTNSGLMRGTIASNVIGNGALDSGSVNAFGIAVDMRGDVDAVLAIDGNTVRNTDVEGIFVQSRLDNDADGEIGRVDVTVNNNVVAAPDDNSAFPFGLIYGTRIEARNTSDLCLDISGNDATGIGGFEDFRVRQRDTSTFRAERLLAGLQNAATMESHVVAQNVAGSTASATAATGFTGVANGACRTP